MKREKKSSIKKTGQSSSQGAPAESNASVPQTGCLINRTQEALERGFVIAHGGPRRRPAPDQDRAPEPTPQPPVGDEGGANWAEEMQRRAERLIEEGAMPNPELWFEALAQVRKKLGRKKSPGLH